MKKMLVGIIMIMLMLCMTGCMDSRLTKSWTETRMSDGSTHRVEKYYDADRNVTKIVDSIIYEN